MWDLKWFPKWNRENPTDVYGPAIVIGAAFGAVVVAALIIAWGNPAQTVSVQTGPAGTGMSHARYAAVALAPDPDAEAYQAIMAELEALTAAATTAAVPAPAAQELAAQEPAAGETPAGEAPAAPAADEQAAAEAVAETAAAAAADASDDKTAPTPIGDSAAGLSPRLVVAMREWTGIPDLFGPEPGYQTDVAKKMIAMTQALNEDWDGHVGEAGVTCFTCHRGQAQPSYAWFRISPGLSAVKGWSANQNLATRQTVSTSLPHDALEKYLLEDNQIGVHDDESRVASDVTDPDTPTWQNAERTYSLMNYFADSLGRNCVFCHNSRAFNDGSQVTPQWATAFAGIDMVREINQEHFLPLAELLPDGRLGPKHGDAPKMACKTCHKGANKPLGGLSMYEDWPELAARSGE